MGNRSSLFFMATIGLALYAGESLAEGNSFVLPDGVNRAPAMALHCVMASGGAAPCGTASSPLVVTSPVGGPSSANQLLQLGAEQSSAQALGGTGDTAFAGGQGSVVALLKGLWSLGAVGVPAVPVGGVLISRSVNLNAGSSTVVFPANASRRYFSFQVPQSSGVWINLMGGTAAPNALDCAFFAAGTFYESGQFINRGPLAVYAPVAATFSAWEN